MSGRISGLGWTGGAAGYVNPDMPPEVVRALAERGLNPDGSRMATADRLRGLDDRISADWAAMGFAPSARHATGAVASPPEPDIFAGANSPFADPEYLPANPPAFGGETRAKLDAHTAKTNADYEARMAVADAILGATSAPSFGDQGRGRPVTPFAAVKDKAQPAAAVADTPKPPKPTARPRPTSYTVKAGDNPSTIAKAFGMSLKDLEAKNPGILKKARRLKIGAMVKV